MDEELNITLTEFGESFFIGNNLLLGQFDESLVRCVGEVELIRMGLKIDKTWVTSIDDPFQRILSEDVFVTVLGDPVTKLFFYPFSFLSFLLYKKN